MLRLGLVSPGDLWARIALFFFLLQRFMFLSILPIPRVVTRLFLNRLGNNTEYSIQYTSE